MPGLKIVLGHLGEGIPVQLWRIDGRNGWMKAKHKYAAKHGVGHYFRKHFHLTTSGNFHTPSLVNVSRRDGRGARDVLGRLAVRERRRRRGVVR